MKSFPLLGSLQNGLEGGGLVNGLVERSSKEPSPTPSPSLAKKNKNSQSSTLPLKSQDSPVQMEGLLHRKHEWEGHSKKASNRQDPPHPPCTLCYLSLI